MREHDHHASTNAVRMTGMRREPLVPLVRSLLAETRPGRGQDLSAWATDGEYMATQHLDVYGNGPLIVSSIELMHNDADEEHFDEDGNCEHE